MFTVWFLHNIVVIVKYSCPFFFEKGRLSQTNLRLGCSPTFIVYNDKRMMLN